MEQESVLEVSEKVVLREVDGPKAMKREIKLIDAVLMVVGSMIGSGIFIVAADMTRNVGSAGWLIIAWVITGIMTLVAAVSYGELSGMFPKAGGQYVYLKEAYNPLIGFLYGWSFFTVIQSGLIAAVAVAFAKFSAYFIPQLSEDLLFLNLGFLQISPAQMVAIGLIIVLTYINTRGVKAGKIIQTSFTIAKLLSLFALIVFGFLFMDKAVWDANWTDAWSLHKLNLDNSIETYTTIAAFGAIASAMVGSIFATDAWNSITFIAGEVVNPKRNIGLSLFLGTLIVCTIFLLTNLMYTAVLPMLEIAGAEKDRVGVEAAAVIFGGVGTGIIALMIMISTFGCNNGLVLSGARVYYTMAHDGLFFKRTGKLNKNAVPGFALWIQCIMASILCLSGKYGDLLDMISFVVVLFYVLTIAGIFILRKRQPDTERPYKAFGYPILPALYIIMGTAFCGLLIIYKPGFTWGGLIIVLLGLPVYYLTQYFDRGRERRLNN
jgi:basic amino acid/polyamine antiporter, APA family